VQSIDSIAAAWPGWELAHHGNVWLEHIPNLPPLPWFTTVHGHLVSNRTPGVILAGLPLQLLLMPFASVGPLYVATLTAVIVTAAAMSNLALLSTRLGATPRWAAGAALLAGLGTGFWNNGSGELWPHGPDALWLSLAALALCRDQWWRAGVALGAAVLTRPHLALVVAALAVTLLGRRHALRPALRLSLPTGAALLVLIVWNAVVFHAPGITGGYAEQRVNADHLTWGDTATHVVGTLVSPLRGVLVFSPFVLPLLVLLWRQRRALPDWTIGLSVGAALYQCAQWRLTSFEGGTGFYGYRYFLEPFVLLFPAAVAAALRDPRRLDVILRVLAGFSVAVTAVGAFFYRATVGIEGPSPWRTWGTASAILDHGRLPGAFAVAILVAIWAAIAVRLPHCEEEGDLLSSSETNAARRLLAP
jgi:hypothetical protein